jgi:hypothetical protein
MASKTDVKNIEETQKELEAATNYQFSKDSAITDFGHVFSEVYVIYAFQVYL